MNKDLDIRPETLRFLDGNIADWISLVVQWLRLCTFTAAGTGLITVPSWGSFTCCSVWGEKNQIPTKHL